MGSRKLFCISTIVFLCLIAGCANNEFDLNYNQFKESYLIATEFVDKDNTLLNALKIMDIETVETELKTMKEAMDKMDKEAKSKQQKGIYENAERYYNGLNNILEYSKNFENLSRDEKDYAEIEVIMASRYRESWKKEGDE